LDRRCGTDEPGRNGVENIVEQVGKQSEHCKFEAVEPESAESTVSVDGITVSNEATRQAIGDYQSKLPLRAYSTARHVSQ
jgi:hypothetical protein